MAVKELDYIVSKGQFSNSDIEKDDEVSASSVHESQVQQEPLGRWDAFVDSFRKMEESKLTLDPNLTEVQKTAIISANAPLSRKLKDRHLQMIAIGGSIGTGLFVGSGQVLANGGPASVVIAYSLVGFMMYCVVHALGELAVTFPVSGSFVTYNNRFLDPSWSFAMSWNYAFNWLVCLPTELVAGAIIIQYWDTNTNPAVYCIVFFVVIMAINLFGVKGYGEAEFVFSFIKVIAVIGFIILGIVIVCGGGPKGGYIGGKYWHNPGPFNHGFKGLCSVFVTAAFAFGGTELVGLASAETSNPRKSIPKATKQVFWRILLFYVVSLIVVGCLVPYNDEDLQKSDGTARYSPFVIGIKNAGISGLPSVMNAVILVAVLSVGNSSVYASSRTLAAIGAIGSGPKWLSFIDKKGRPMAGIIISGLFGLICLASASKKQGTAFTWLSALSGMATLFSWGSVCACHLRFRYALKAKGRNTDELAFTSQAGIIGSVFGLTLNILVIVLQFWIALWPVGGSPDAYDFFETYLSVPVVLVCYVGHKLWTRNWRWYLPVEEIDIDTGRRELDLDLLKQEIADEKARLAAKPLYYRIWNLFC